MKHPEPDKNLISDKPIKQHTYIAGFIHGFIQD